MPTTHNMNPQSVARVTGAALLATIVIGIVGSIFIAPGIDINLTADVVATAENMLEAETRLRAKAWLAVLLLGLEAVVAVGLYLLLRRYGPLLSGWSLFIGLVGSVLTFLGAVYAMNSSLIAGKEAFTLLTDDKGRTLLAALQASSDYTSFHLGLVIASAANAGFFALFLRSGLIPKVIAGFGIFASLFVVSMVVARDFLPALGANALTFAGTLFVYKRRPHTLDRLTGFSAKPRAIF